MNFTVRDFLQISILVIELGVIIYFLFPEIFKRKLISHKIDEKLKVIKNLEEYNSILENANIQLVKENAKLKENKNSFVDEYLNSPQIKGLLDMAGKMMKGEDTGDTLTEDLQKQYLKQIEVLDDELKNLSVFNDELLDRIRDKENLISELEQNIKHYQFHINNLLKAVTQKNEVMKFICKELNEIKSSKEFGKAVSRCLSAIELHESQIN